jgi:hypothetical protein
MGLNRWEKVGRLALLAEDLAGWPDPRRDQGPPGGVRAIGAFRRGG